MKTEAVPSLRRTTSVYACARANMTYSIFLPLIDVVRLPRWPPKRGQTYTQVTQRTHEIPGSAGCGNRDPRTLRTHVNKTKKNPCICPPARLSTKRGKNVEKGVERGWARKREMKIRKKARGWIIGERVKGKIILGVKKRTPAHASLPAPALHFTSLHCSSPRSWPCFLIRTNLALPIFLSLRLRIRVPPATTISFTPQTSFNTPYTACVTVNL